MFLVASFGTINTAAFGIATRMMSLIIIPSIGISIAASTLVGQNMGAKKIERAAKVVKISAMAAFLFLTLAGILMFLFAKQLSLFFVPGEFETIETTVLIIRLMALTFGFIGIQMVIEGAFKAAGSTIVSMVLSLATIWVVQFPLAYVLSNHTSLAEIGIWIAFPVANIVGGVMAIIWFSRGIWKNKKITEEIKISEKVLEEATIEEGIN